MLFSLSSMRRNVLSMRMHHARAAISAAMATRCMAAPHRTAASSAAVAAATQVRGGVHLAKPVSLPRANPPPTSERSLGLQRLYAVSYTHLTLPTM